MTTPGGVASGSPGGALPRPVELEAAWPGVPMAALRGAPLAALRGAPLAALRGAPLAALDGASKAARPGVSTAARRGTLLAALLAFSSVCSGAAPSAASEPLVGAGLAASAADRTAPRSAAEVTDIRARSGATMPARTELLEAGEAALRRGDTAAALDAFDRAALMLHAGDTEMLQVRAQLQAGRYREALAFCAHTVGAHRELAAPAALYAWLLQAGGQPAVARWVLAEAQTRLPDDPLLAAAARELAAPWPDARDRLLESPQRLAPEALSLDGRPPADAARVVASGALVGSGAQALVPLDAVSNAARIWVRNGLGQTVEARIERRLPALHLALLGLARPLGPPPGFAVAPRDPFGGSVGHAVDYRAGDGEPAAPAWPWLHLGFFGAVAGDGGARRLGIGVPPGPGGGPVFDAAGRLAGLAMKGDDGGDVLLPVSALGDTVDDAARTAAPRTEPGAAAPRMAVDDIYERALRVALQVIVVR